jgi:hypothetical protein
MGVAPDASLIQKFDAAFDRVEVIGDAQNGGKIYQALKQGFTIACGI